MIVYLEPNRKRVLKDVFFALQLGFQVVSSFIGAVFIGLWIDQRLHSEPIAILVLLLLAFLYVIKLLLGVGKHE